MLIKGKCLSEALPLKLCEQIPWHRTPASPSQPLVSGVASLLPSFDLTGPAAVKRTNSDADYAQFGASKRAAIIRTQAISTKGEKGGGEGADSTRRTMWTDTRMDDLLHAFTLQFSAQGQAKSLATPDAAVHCRTEAFSCKYIRRQHLGSRAAKYPAGRFPRTPNSSVLSDYLVSGRLPHQRHEDQATKKHLKNKGSYVCLCP